MLQYVASCTCTFCFVLFNVCTIYLLIQIFTNFVSGCVRSPAMMHISANCGGCMKLVAGKCFSGSNVLITEKTFWGFKHLTTEAWSMWEKCIYQVLQPPPVRRLELENTCGPYWCVQSAVGAENENDTLQHFSQRCISSNYQWLIRCSANHYSYRSVFHWIECPPQSFEYCIWAKMCLKVLACLCIIFVAMIIITQLAACSDELQHVASVRRSFDFCRAKYQHEDDSSDYEAHKFKEWTGWM